MSGTMAQKMASRFSPKFKLKVFVSTINEKSDKLEDNSSWAFPIAY